MRISIITVNFNGSEKTLKLLKSLGNQTDKDFEIIIVDNASEENDFTNLQQLIHIPTSQVGYPQAKVVRNSENLGFSGGNNVGIRQALQSGSDWVVLLNNDTWVEKDFMERLRANLKDKRGIIGLPIDEGWGVSYAGKIKWLSRPRKFHIRDLEQAKKERNKYAIGGGMAINKNVFDKMGFLDEKYFLYFEDVDYSVRAKKNKIPVQFLESPVIHHAVSSTTKKLGQPLILRYHYRNALYFNFKNGSWYIKIFVPFWLLIIFMKQISKILVIRNIKEPKAIICGLNDFIFGRMKQINPKS